MMYLIFLILGPVLIFIGSKTRGRSEGSGAMFLLSFLWLSVQVAGVLYSILKVKYDVDPGLTPFDLFDYTTWSGPVGLYMVGFAIYFLALFIFFNLLQMAQLSVDPSGDWDAGIRCAGVCRWSDSGLRLYSAEAAGNICEDGIGDLSGAYGLSIHFRRTYIYSAL